MPGSRGDPARDGARAVVYVDQDGGLAEEAGHVGLGEEKAAGAGRGRPGEGRGRVDGVGVLDLVEPTRARERVHRTPLPGQPTEHRGATERAEVLGDDQRAGDVAAAADPEDQRARRVVQTSAGIAAPLQIASISSAARSNSSSDRTGVPSNGRSRCSSSQERQPPYSSRTLTVTGRGIR